MVDFYGALGERMSGRHHDRVLPFVAGQGDQLVELAQRLGGDADVGHLVQHHLPDLGPFIRFELPTIGHIYDANGQSLIELAREYREVTRYDEIPPIVRDAILSAEDKRFFWPERSGLACLRHVCSGGDGTTRCMARHCFRKAGRRSPSSSCVAASCAR